MDFRLSEGPWKSLFKGKLDEFEVELCTNPESLILVSIMEKEAGRIVGAAIEVFKVFQAIGELQGFVETLPREVIAVTKHDEKETIQFFILGSRPNYVPFREEEFSAEVEEMIKNINASTKMLKDVGKAYELELRELHQCSENIKEAFFSQPLMLSMLATSYHPGAPGMEMHAAAKTISFGELILGITKEGMPVKEPLSLFNSTIVSNGNSGERAHALHLLAESALLSSIPAIVIDWENKFQGLSNKTGKAAGLKEYKVEIDPIGFPLREFFVPQQVKVDLKLVNKKGLMQLFGLGESIAGKEIQQTMGEEKADDLIEVMKAAREKNVEGEFNEFQRNRAIRILKLMNLRYPELFNGSNDVEEISKGWLKGLGRASVIRLQELDERISLLVVHSLVKGLLEYFKRQGFAKQLKCFFILPEAESVVPREEENEIVKAIAHDLNEMRQYGIGFALGCEHEIDLPDSLVAASEAKISIVKGNDAGIQLKGRKNYRVLLRPGLSECSELK